MNILFFAVFLLFSILILRLGVLQIVQGEEYTNQVEQKDEISVDYSVPRGEIYDRNYQKVVYNIPQKAITYTPSKNPQPDDLLDVSKKLGQIIQMTDADKEKVTERDKKDIWLLENKNGDSLITKEEKEMLKDKKLSDSDIYQMKLDRITEEQLKSVDINVASIYRKLFNAVALTPTIVKNADVTDEEFAYISENLADLPGVNITTDWDRKKTYDTALSTVLGNWSQGLPAEQLEYYESKGYNLNDRVGVSYIEELYEDVLRGTKSKVKTVTDKNNNVVDTKVISEGQSGKDLVLTVDMDLQVEVEKIIEEEIQKMKEYPNTDTLDRAFVVVMNPKTGEVLTLAGKQYTGNKKTPWYDYAHGTFTSAYESGSAVKGATVLTGYQTGVISPGDQLLDEVFNIKGTQVISSYKVMGWIDDLTALERSSNVYMWKVAIAIMDGHYVSGQALPLNTDKIDLIRYYFSQFGLGTKTGIGFSEEIEGLKGAADVNAFQIGIGQLDTYTPLQLAQYVSTIANGGYRMQPLLVKEIRNPDVNDNALGSTIIEEMQPKVLNRIDMKSEWIEHVQEGFWRVTHGSQGTARSFFVNEPYDAAGKTGTAQSYKDGKSTYNLSFVGYAPFDDPEIAISVIVPNAYYGSNQPYSISNVISQRVFRKYFELKEKRQNNDLENDEAENNTEETDTEENLQE
ncbi:penicillin-binding protein 2 [Caldibacillus lycopersici]|uniref:serine-type D-Ala-D-Ala carboxypeptidase n=1 Tax=Perspicuibacillus lycopersici TaxID=1325689 RepID=A0AAE3ISM3_9BACI|nr:penicillin-binding protein 2 [Perspicuibacillus lycopersici]MCU9613883.1 penicillin-binding protein 2 [Perspicuibacillus lycopersici]